MDFDSVIHPVTSNGRYFRVDKIIPLTRCLLGLSGAPVFLIDGKAGFTMKD
jgi:hypothetical protein